MASVDVLTVSKRQGWEETAVACLNGQSKKPDNWIIVTELPLQIPDGVAEVYQAPPKKYHSNLNASLNEGLRHCTSDYVVLYQDFIELEYDTIEKLVAAAESTGGFVTTATVNPDGKQDGRYLGLDTLHPCIPEEWEANVAVAPLKAFRELGGFEEELDRGWSWDNVHLALRAEMLGYKFYIDESIKPQLLFHVKEPDLDKTLELNDVRCHMDLANIRAGKKPVKLPYL